MNEKLIPVKIDPRGRITIPRKIREELGIKEGDFLLLEESENGVITLKKISHMHTSTFDEFTEEVSERLRKNYKFSEDKIREIERLLMSK